MNRGLLVLASLFLLFLPGSPSLAQEAPPADLPVLTLQDAIHIAQGNNPNLKNALLASSIAEDKIAEARTSRYPSIKFYALGSQLLTPLDFTFDKGVFGTFPGIGPIPADRTKIHTPLRPTFFAVTQAAQPLSQQYKIGLNIRLAGLGKTLSDEKLRAQQHQVANQVKQAYYGLLRTQSSLDVSRENLKLDAELHRLMQQNVEQKTALKADAMEIQTRLAQEEYNQQVLRDSLATQKEQLNNLLGRDVRTDFSVVPAPEAPAVALDLEAARAKALAARPELRQSRLGLQQAMLNRRITKSSYIPDVSLALNNLSLFNASPFLPSNVASAGILFSWDPLDWGRRKHELAEASKTIEQSKNSVSDLESQILIEVGDKFRKFQQTHSLLRVADLGLASAQERLRVTMNQFEQKTALLKDVLQLKSAVQNATDQHQQALLAFWTAKADFEKALGED